MATPEKVAALRKTWRESLEHKAEQLARFVRLTLFAAVPVVADLIVKGKGDFDFWTLAVGVVPVAEVAWRQVFPALGAKKADSAPGTVTTVGSEDGLTAEPEPVQTDNRPRPEDPVDQPPQDPAYLPPSDDIEEPLDVPSETEGDLS